MDPDQSNTNHGPLRDGAEPGPTYHQEIPAERRDGDANDGKQGNKDERPSVSEWSWPDYVGLVFDGLVAVATVVGVVFLVLQWKQTERALEEARQSTAESRAAAAEAREANRLTREARAAEQAEDAAREIRENRMLSANELTAQSARDAMRTQREARQEESRAWVRLESGEFSPLGPGTSAWGNLTIVNTGRTPAYNVQVRTFVTANPLIRGQLNRPISDYPSARPTTPINSPTVLQPGMIATHRFDGRESLSSEARELLESTQPNLGVGPHPYGFKGMALIVLGEIHYVDTFKRPRITRFCLYRDDTRTTSLCPDNNYAQ